MVDPSRPTPRSNRRGDPRFEDRLEGRLDQWMAAGRQLVDGVAGARPGSRPSARGAGSRAGSGPRLDGLGRWVENKLDWLLEDEEGWRESWEQPAAPVRERESESEWPTPRQPRSARQPLEAISRRVTPQLPPRAASPSDAWPDDDSFSVNRWRREAAPNPNPNPDPQPPAAGSGRALPRSTRRR